MGEVIPMYETNTVSIDEVIEGKARVNVTKSFWVDYSLEALTPSLFHQATKYSEAGAGDAEALEFFIDFVPRIAIAWNLTARDRRLIALTKEDVSENVPLGVLMRVGMAILADNTPGEVKGASSPKPSRARRKSS